MRNIIHVTNQIHARAIAKDYDATISLGWDVEAEFRKPDSNFTIPSLAHVHQIMDFARNIQPGEKVLINCYAGHSRSPATAIIVLVTLGIKHFVEAKETILDHLIPATHYTGGVKPNDILLQQFTLR